MLAWSLQFISPQEDDEELVLFSYCWSDNKSQVHLNVNFNFLLFLRTLLSHPFAFPAGVLVCKTVPFVQTTAIVTGILTMTCIAIERYQGIVFPLKMRRQYSSKRAYKMLGIVYLPEWFIIVFWGIQIRDSISVWKVKKHCINTLIYVLWKFTYMSATFNSASLQPFAMHFLCILLNFLTCIPYILDVLEAGVLCADCCLFLLLVCLHPAGLVWIASVIVGSPMLFVQQLEVSAH